MKKTIIFVFLIACIRFQAQIPVSFYTRYGSEQDDVANCIVETLGGGYILVGQTTGFGAMQNDILLSKTDTAGVPVWNKIFGGISADIGKAVVELPDSGFVFVGYSNSFGNGGYDAIIYRVDKAGNQLWQKTFGGLNWDFAYSINKTSDGNLVVCGATYSFGRGRKDAFILKVDYDGNFLWTKIYGGEGNDVLNKIIQTTDGGYIAAGTTESYGDSLGDIWITKLDAYGDSSWFVTQGGNKKDVGNAIVEDSNHDYLITGGSESFSSGMEDAYIFKLSHSGSFVWHQFYGLSTEDEESFDVLNSGSAYGSILITFGTKEQHIYGLDIKTILLNDVGYYMQGGSFGGPNDDIGYSLCNTRDKGYVACGYTESFNAQLKDCFIVKYDSEMTIGPLIVAVKEYANTDGIKIYPTFTSGNIISVEHNDPNRKISVNIYDIYGTEIIPSEIKEEKNNLLQIYLPENMKGVIFVCLNNRSIVRKCIIH